MKKKLLLPYILAAALFLNGCGFLDEESSLLKEAASIKEVSQTTLQSEEYQAFLKSYESFAALFGGEYFKHNSSENFSVSPLSVFMGLSLASECSSGNTRAQILNALDLTYEQLYTYTSTLYSASTLEEERVNVWGRDKVVSRQILSNSIWIDETYEIKQDCLQTLADNYYCYSYTSDFFGDNTGTNRSVSEFVKAQTKKMIDKNFNFSQGTEIALLNTIYLSDIWSEEGGDLAKTMETYSFKESDGDVTQTNLLESYYELGRVANQDDFSHFYAETLAGYKVHFLLPSEENSLADVFTAQNIQKIVQTTDYHSIDEEQKNRYYTRVLFPAFSANTDTDVYTILKTGFGIHDLFSSTDCNFTALTDDTAYCSGMRHVTKLRVDEKGVEGRAVTLKTSESTSPKDDYTDVFEEFVVDGAFGFVICDRNGVIVFSGAVHNL